METLFFFDVWTVDQIQNGIIIFYILSTLSTLYHFSPSARLRHTTSEILFREWWFIKSISFWTSVRGLFSLAKATKWPFRMLTRQLPQWKKFSKNAQRSSLILSMKTKRSFLQFSFLVELFIKVVERVFLWSTLLLENLWFIRDLKYFSLPRGFGYNFLESRDSDLEKINSIATMLWMNSKECHFKLFFFYFSSESEKSVAKIEMLPIQSLQCKFLIDFSIHFLLYVIKCKMKR